MVENQYFSEDKKKVKKSVGDFKCGGCGANLVYDPNTHKLVCNHCGFTQNIEINTFVAERDFSELSAHKFGQDDKVKTVTCTNCGATEILKNDEIASRCPFCSSPLVVNESEIDSVKPDSLIPFMFDSKRAKEHCNNWIKSRWFAAHAFKKELKLNNPNGIYYPIWTFDSHTMTTYQGRLGKTYTTTHTDSKGHVHTTTHVRWFNVDGTRKNYFDDIIINASGFVEDRTISKLMPYPQNLYTVYSNEYLAGFLANHYTVDPFTAFKTAEDRMRETIKQEIIRSYNADRVDYLNMNMVHNQKSFKSMFVPIYLTGAKYKEKFYRQYINGATGKILGAYPKSIFKISLVILLILGLIGVIAYFALTR